MTLLEPETVAAGAPSAPGGTRRPLRVGEGRVLALVATLAVVTIVLLAAGVEPGVAGVAFLLVGPGAIVRHWLRTSPAGNGMVLVSVATSASVLMLLASAALWTHTWHPKVATTVLAGVVGALAAWTLRRDVPWHALVDVAADLPRPRAPRSRRTIAAAGLTALAAILWAASLPSIDPGDPVVGGLFAGASPAFGASFVVAIVAFLAAVRVRSWAVALAAFAVTLLVLRGTTVVVSGEPMFNWTYKHLGVVDWIVHEAWLVGSADIYHNWPGFFAASAWIDEATGVSPTTQARWFTLGVTVLTCMAIAALARQALFASRWAGLVAGFLFLLWNWIGQDYFAPQALGLLLAAVVVRLALLRDPRGGLLAILVFAGMVVSHQLTPFVVLGAIWILLLARKVRWWVAVAFAIIAIGYVGLHLDVLDRYGIFSGFDPVQNAQTPASFFTSTAKQIDAYSARGAMALVWLATAAALAVRLSRRRDWLVGAVLAFLPFGILAVQSYGGEGLLRTALFSLLGCAIVLGVALHTLLVAPGRLRALLAAVFVLVTAGLAAQAYYGPWYVNQVQASELDTGRLLLRDVPRPAYIATAVPSWPDRPDGQYVRWLQEVSGSYDDSAFDTKLTGLSYRTPAEIARLERELSSHAPWPTFLIVGERMEAANAYRGFYTPDALENLRRTLPTRRGWSVVVREPGVVVLRYVPPAAEGQPAATWRAPR